MSCFCRCGREADRGALLRHSPSHRTEGSNPSTYVEDPRSNIKNDSMLKLKNKDNFGSWFFIHFDRMSRCRSAGGAVVLKTTNPQGYAGSNPVNGAILLHKGD